jgi:hypothetical protein
MTLHPSSGSERFFAGVGFSPGRRRATVAVLTSRLDVQSLEAMGLTDAAERLCGFRQATAAIGGPLRPAPPADPPEGPLGASFRAGRAAPLRAGEADLLRRGIPVRKTPALESAAPAWMRAALQLAADLTGRGFSAGRGDREAGRWLIETHPAACAAALLARLPFGRETIEGRIQRQLALLRERVALRDPMDALEELTAHHILSGRLALEGIRTPDELDALLAAFTAWRAFTSPENAFWLGGDSDGWICLPAKDIPDKFPK